MMTILVAVLTVALAADPGQEPDAAIPGLGITSTLHQLTGNQRWVISMDMGTSRRRLTSVLEPTKQLSLPRRVGHWAVSPDGRWMFNESEHGYALFDISASTEPVLVTEVSKQPVSHIDFSLDSRYVTITQGESQKSWLLHPTKPLANPMTFPRFYLVTDRWRIETVGATELRLTRLSGNSAESSLQIAPGAEVVMPERASRCDVRYSFPKPRRWQTQHDWMVVLEPTRTLIVDLRSDDPTAAPRIFNHRPPKARYARIALDGSWLVFPQAESFVLLDTATEQMRAYNTGGPLELRPEYEAAESYVDETGFERSADGRWLCYVGIAETEFGIGRTDKYVARLWDLNSPTNDPVMKFDDAGALFADSGARWTFAFSQDSRWLLGVPRYGEAQVVDLSKPINFQPPDVVEGAAQCCTAVSEDRRFAAQWNTDTGRLLSWALGRPGAMPMARAVATADSEKRFLEFIPGTNILLAVAGGTFTAWNLELEKPPAVALAPYTPSPGGWPHILKRDGDIATLRDGGYLRWWDVREQPPRVTIAQRGEYSKGVVIGHKDNTLCMWNAAHAGNPWVLRDDGIAWARFTRDGTWIIAGTTDKDILLWDAVRLIKKMGAQ